MEAFKNADMTVMVTAGAESALALYDAPAVDQFGEMVAVEHVIEFPHFFLPGLKKGDSLTIQGVTYRAKNRRPMEDGKWIRVELAR